MNQIFTSFHELMVEASKLIETLSISNGDEHVLTKQAHVFQSLVDAQLNALQLETAMQSARTHPRT